MTILLLLTSAGLGVSAFITVMLALSPGRGKDERRYLSVVCAQAALLFLKDVVEEAGGPGTLTTFLIFANFLFGLPALYLFLCATLEQPVRRPLIHFVPALANLPAAALVARRAIGSEGVDSAVASGAGLDLYLPLLYLNALAAAETLQLVLYARAGLRQIAGSVEARRKGRRTVTLAIIGAYAVYYGVRWTGLGIRVLKARGDGLSPLPAWVNASSMAFVALFVAFCGMHVITHTDILDWRAAAAKGKYGGRPLRREDGERIARLAEEQLSACADLSPESVDPRRLAARIRVPYYLLSRAVNEFRGRTVSDLIRETRVERAKVLLDTRPEDSILQIALESGFTAKSSFNAAFQKTVGMSPREYRRRTG